MQRLREELEVASQAKMFFEDELIALRDQNKAHADAQEEDPSKGNQRDLFEGERAGWRALDGIGVVGLSVLLTVPWW